MINDSSSYHFVDDAALVLENTREIFAANRLALLKWNKRFELESSKPQKDAHLEDLGLFADIAELKIKLYPAVDFALDQPSSDSSIFDKVYSSSKVPSYNFHFSKAGSFIKTTEKQIHFTSEDYYAPIRTFHGYSEDNYQYVLVFSENFERIDFGYRFVEKADAVRTRY